jgi:CRP-like cAMP-binding protein
MTDKTAVDLVRESPFGREMNEEEVRVLAGLVTVRDLRDGEVLVEEGHSDSTLHVVVSGAIKVAHRDEDGRQNTLHTMTAHDFVGELSFMDDEVRYASLIASGPTRVFSLNREKFETLVATHPRVVYKAMRAIMRVVHAIQRRLSMQMIELQNYIYKTHGKY